MRLSNGPSVIDEKRSAMRSVGILAFDAMDVLDYAGPYEVFSIANAVSGGGNLATAAIGVNPGPVEALGGFSVLPPATIDDGPSPDVLVVPGGRGSRALAEDDRVIEWVRSAADRAEAVVSVCTGALVLGAAGLLAHRPATTHHRAFDQLRAISPSTSIVEDRRFVRSSDRIWTSAGISAGIDLSLHLVEFLAGSEVKDQTTALLEWGW